MFQTDSKIKSKLCLKLKNYRETRGIFLIPEFCFQKCQGSVQITLDEHDTSGKNLKKKSELKNPSFEEH